MSAGRSACGEGRGLAVVARGEPDGRESGWLMAEILRQFNIVTYCTYANRHGPGQS